MATITEDYVSFEIAKLLNIKGFKGEFHKHYWGYENGKEFLTESSFNSEYDYPAPTLQTAMKWLREVHDLHIEVLPWCADEKEKEENKKRWLCKVYKLYGMYGCDIYTNETPKSYEEACEAAIKYCLENLI